MRSKGCRFTLGVWGLRVCSLDVAFVAATVRNRSQPFARLLYGRAYGKFSRGGHFWRFHTWRCFVSRGRRGTSWHSDVFCNVSKIVLCGRRNTLATFSEDALQFSWQAQHFGRVHRHFAWQAQHFRRVVLGVFANRIGRAASSGDKVQVPWQAWQFVRCAEKWRKPRTKHWFWGSKFRGSYETFQENIDSETTKCENWRRSRTKCSFFCTHVSRLESLVFLWEAAKPLLFEGFQAGCHVVLRGRRGTLWRSNLFDNVSKMSKLEKVSHEMLVFLHPRVSSRVSGFPVASPCLWGKLRTPHSTLHNLHFRLHTLHFNYTPNFTLCTLHSSLLTWDFTLHTPHFTLHTPHSTLYTLHSTFHTLYSTLLTLHSTLYTFHSALQTGNRGNMYKTVQIDYCRKVLCVTAYPCVLTSVPLTYVWAFGFVGCIFFFSWGRTVSSWWNLPRSFTNNVGKTMS